MSEYKSDKELYDQFAEAATALIMRQYATSAGRTVMKTAPMQKTSEELDERCRKQIKRNLRKQQMKVVAKMALRYTKRVAMFIVMLFGIVGILFTTVEAVRVPIINFFIEQKDGYMEITGDSNDRNAGKTIGETSELDSDDPLKGLLPEDYIRVSIERSIAGSVAVLYENQQGKFVHLFADPYIGSIHVDTEDVVSIEAIRIDSFEAVLTQKNGYQIVWLNTDSNTIYHIDANALEREELIALAENIENFH